MGQRCRNKCHRQFYVRPAERYNWFHGKIKNDKWIEYAQYSYECQLAGGEHLSAREVLVFRDHAFHAFFENNDRYFDNIWQKFGDQYVESIKEMTKNIVSRKFFEGEGEINIIK